jgi:hypothetical protein
MGASSQVRGGGQEEIKKIIINKIPRRNENVFVEEADI